MMALLQVYTNIKWQHVTACWESSYQLDFCSIRIFVKSINLFIINYYILCKDDLTGQTNRPMRYNNVMAIGINTVHGYFFGHTFLFISLLLLHKLLLFLQKGSQTDLCMISLGWHSKAKNQYTYSCQQTF